MSIFGWIYVIGFIAMAGFLLWYCGTDKEEKKSKADINAEAIVIFFSALIWPLMVCVVCYVLYVLHKEDIDDPSDGSVVENAADESISRLKGK